MFEKYFQPAPKIRPLLNLGCLMDIPTGRYLPGIHGESILNGGLAYITGVGGRGNMFKSVLLHFFTLRLMDRYTRLGAQVQDTETSVTYARFQALAVHMLSLMGIDLEDSGRLFLSDNTVMMGNEWFAQMRKFGDDKKKDSKNWTATTPFLDEKTGKLFEILYPTIFELDSLSMFMTDSVENIYEKNQIGDGGANVDSLKGAAAKSQMLMQMPTVTGQANLYLTMSMHVGDQHNLDVYNPKQKQLTFMKQNVSFKHVPQKVTFLTNNLWYIMNAQVLANKGTKAPEYPKDSTDNMEGDTDLQIISIVNLRAKNGPSGIPFELILSQSEGILVGLSEFNHIKSFDRYGIGGNDRTYFLDIYPDVNLSRTTIRGKIDEDAKLRRALEITSEMCQMKFLWDDVDNLFISPKELYETLKSKGYDWDVLLTTRGYWVFEEEADDLPPYLSTMDLLRMAKDLYRPWWYDAVVGNGGSNEAKSKGKK